MRENGKVKFYILDRNMVTAETESIESTDKKTRKKDANRQVVCCALLFILLVFFYSVPYVHCMYFDMAGKGDNISFVVLWVCFSSLFLPDM